MPGPITAAIVGSLVSTGLGVGVTALSGGFKKPKLPQPAKPQQLNTGEDTTLKPGEKTNLINTTPQGVLSDAKTGRNKILGG